MILVNLEGGTFAVPVQKSVTVIDGIKLSFSGTFASTIDSINEGWRPGLRDLDPKVNNAPGNVIAADSPDHNSTISFTKGDQPLQLRQWSPAPNVTVTKAEAISPSFELTTDILKGATVNMISGKFEHNMGQHEHIINPVIHLKDTTDSIISLSILARTDDSAISDTGTTTTGVNVTAKIDAAAMGGNLLAQWLSGTIKYPAYPQGDARYTLTSILSPAKYQWENAKFKVAKETKFDKSIGAKAILAAQAKYGDSKTKVQMKLDYWDGWDLTGKVEEGLLTTPTR